MSSAADETDFDENLFKHTRMSFWDHIEELRTHMWRAIIGFMVALIGCLFLGMKGVDFISAPVVEELTRFYDERVRKAKENAEVHPDDPLNQPTAFNILTFDRQQLDAVIKGLPTEKINGFPRPLTEKELVDEKKKNNGEEPTNTKLIKDYDLVKLWVRIEQPVNYGAAQAKTLRDLVGVRPSLKTMSIMEAFMVWLKVSMYLGFIVGSPWIFYQLWSFIAAGLYPSEKRYVHKYLPLSLGLFLSGCAVCQFGVMPLAIRYLLSWNESLGLEPDLRLNEWLHFAILFPLVFGISFQTPLVMLVLYKLGIVEIEMYIKHWRIALFAMAVISMLLLPTGDPFSMIAMTVPLWVLYALGIILCKMSPREKFEEEDEESEGVVGV
jgi:sec-independent protein translocase protein TatC